MVSPARDPLATPPVDDADVPAWVAATGVDGLVDLHVHFLPDRMLQKVWAYFDQAETHYGRAWPIHYREPEQTRIDLLRGVRGAHVRAAGLPAQAGDGRVADVVGAGVGRGGARGGADRDALPRGVGDGLPR